MKIRLFLQRFLMPSFVVTLYYAVRFGAKVSPRAEVELSSNLHLGRGTVVGSFTKIKATHGPLHIGDRGGVATCVFIAAGEAGITIGDNFVCGPNVSISSRTYRYEQLDVPIEDQGTTSQGVRIGNNVWIGANSTVLDGAEIGDNCIVVAHSLVSRRYPPNSIIQGAPAKVILKRVGPSEAEAHA